MPPLSTTTPVLDTVGNEGVLPETTGLGRRANHNRRVESKDGARRAKLTKLRRRSSLVPPEMYWKPPAPIVALGIPAVDNLGAAERRGACRPPLLTSCSPPSAMAALIGDAARRDDRELRVANRLVGGAGAPR